MRRRPLAVRRHHRRDRKLATPSRRCVMCDSGHLPRLRLTPTDAPNSPHHDRPDPASGHRNPVRPDAGGDRTVCRMRFACSRPLQAPSARAWRDDHWMNKTIRSSATMPTACASRPSKNASPSSSACRKTDLALPARLTWCKAAAGARWPRHGCTMAGKSGKLAEHGLWPESVDLPSKRTEGFNRLTVTAF